MSIPPFTQYADTPELQAALALIEGTFADNLKELDRLNNELKTLVEK